MLIWQVDLFVCVALETMLCALSKPYTNMSPWRRATPRLYLQSILDSCCIHTKI